MKERPIIFSGPMVQAILEGRKTQTRRIIKPQPLWIDEPNVPFKIEGANPKGVINCPYGYYGMKLWVRENCKAEELKSGIDGVRYIADNKFIEIDNSSEAADQWGNLASYRMRKSGRPECRLVPSIHMPRWASRITLEITDVRIERLQDISHADAIKEGCFPLREYDLGNEDVTPPRDQYKALWKSINGKWSWDGNPWVWVIAFKRIDAND